MTVFLQNNQTKKVWAKALYNTRASAGITMHEPIFLMHMQNYFCSGTIVISILLNTTMYFLVSDPYSQIGYRSISNFQCGNIM